MSEKLIAKLEAHIAAWPTVYGTDRINVEILTECLAELRVVEGDAWRPIDTAPKDGTFLVYMPDERTKIQVAKWNPNVKVIGNVFAFDLTAPTHWRPLPAPPLDAAGSAEGVGGG